MAMTYASETVKMLVRFYNMQAGSAFRFGTDTTVAAVERALDAAKDAGEGVAEIKNHIRNFVALSDNANDAEAFANCWETYNPAPKAQTAAAPEMPKVTDAQVSYSMGILEQAVVQLIANTNGAAIEQKIMDNCKEQVRDFIKSEYGAIERKIITVIDGQPKKLDGVQHEKFETVVKFVANDEPVYLAGDAGTGKNVLCKQVAKALDLDFYFTNCVTQEYQLTGFTDAMGKFHETEFYKAFTQGGLFMLDEMDASIPETLVVLNAAIANRYFNFPAPIGYVEAHPNFRVIAAGNTYGTGADMNYVGRAQLDAASLNRFAMVKVGYSEAIENNCAGGDKELADFARDYRKAAKKAGVNVVVSYRDITRLAKMTKLLSLEEALETCLVKGLEKDNVNSIVNAITANSKYKTALKNLANTL
jgi:MoxR-like ATPase